MKNYYRGKKVKRFDAGGDASGDDGSSDAGTGGADPGDGSAPGDSGGDAGGNGGDIFTSTATNLSNTAPPVVTKTVTPGIGASRGIYDQGILNTALRSELAARPGTTYADMVRFATDPYGAYGQRGEQGNAYSGITPQEVLNAYDALQGSITPYNQPVRGELYSAAPAIYQPVRYTPEYDQYGQGIASLFGRGYSQYFQPPGLTGTYFFGDPGTAPTFTPSGGASLPGLTPTDRADLLAPIIRPPTAPDELTNAQAERWRDLSDADRATFLGVAQAYNDPGNVQSDAQLLQDYMNQNNLNVADVARITGVDAGTVNSYLGQAGLTDPQLSYYQSIGADQPMYADLAEAYNAPGDTASDARQMLEVMGDKLSAADVSRITGIPLADVNAYLALATPTQPVYEEPAAPAAPTYTTQDIAEAYRQSVGAGAATEAEFIDYARSKGVTDAELIAARDILLGR